jgi:hypothetical protein
MLVQIFHQFCLRIVTAATLPVIGRAASNAHWLRNRICTAGRRSCLGADASAITRKLARGISPIRIAMIRIRHCKL